MPSTTTSPIRQLVDIISSKVSEIETIFEKEGVDYPPLDEPFVPGSQSETASMAPDVGQCAALVMAACAQLSATLGSPFSTLFGISAGVSPHTCSLFSRLKHFGSFMSPPPFT
jgi:hypothetical protein